jgi:hypothetical protein
MLVVFSRTTLASWTVFGVVLIDDLDCGVEIDVSTEYYRNILKQELLNTCNGGKPILDAKHDSFMIKFITIDSKVYGCEATVMAGSWHSIVVKGDKVIEMCNCIWHTRNPAVSSVERIMPHSYSNICEEPVLYIYLWQPHFSLLDWV